LGTLIGGAKAGVVASVWFAGSVSALNALILLIFKSNTISLLGTYSQCAGRAESCFSTLLYPGIPEYDFLRTLILGVFFALSIGIYFDYIPGRTYATRALLPSFIMLLLMLFLGMYGIVADAQQELLMLILELVAATIYALLFARLYRRFTREVEFQSQKAALTKIVVDRRDVTGKTRTFSTNSTHSVEAVSEGKPFKEWLVSGGVRVKDPREAKTKITITGDGLLKAA
jgi:hypothetical protein